MKQQIVMHAIAEHPIQTPLEHRQCVVERDALERHHAVDDELDLGPQPAPDAPGRQQPKVGIGETARIDDFIFAVQRANLLSQKTQRGAHAHGDRRDRHADPVGRHPLVERLAGQLADPHRQATVATSPRFSSCHMRSTTVSNASASSSSPRRSSNVRWIPTVAIPGVPSTIDNASAAVALTKCVEPTRASNTTMPSSKSAKAKCCPGGTRQRVESDGERSRPSSDIEAGSIKAKKRGFPRFRGAGRSVPRYPSVDFVDRVTEFMQAIDAYFSSTLGCCSGSNAW